MASDDYEWDKAYGSLSRLDQKAARIMDPTLKADFWDPQWRDAGWWWIKTPVANPFWRACRNKRRVKSESPEPWFSWEQRLNDDGCWEIIPGSTQQHRTRKEAQESNRQRQEPKPPSALDKLVGQGPDTD